MKATCTNDPSHDLFVTVAHVTEDWVVDANGNFQELFRGSTSEVLVEPHPDNNWHCKICGAEATVDP